MPVFECAAGGHVFIPASRIYEAESSVQQGGLTTRIVAFTANHERFALTDVKGTCAEVGKAIVDELRHISGGPA